MAASDLYVPDSYEGIMPLQVDDAVGDEEASSQEPIKSIATTEQTSNIEKKKKKKKRTRASLDGVEEEKKQVVGINGPGKENLQAADDQKQVKAEEVKVAAASSTPLEGVADMNKSNTKSRSSSSKGITWRDSDEIVILCGLISCKEDKGEYESSKECYAYIRSLLKQGNLKQIKDKVKSLKRKYKTCKAKNMEEGSHEMKLFKLSKLYWGKLEDENENDKEKEEEETVLVQPGEKEIVDVEMTSNDGSKAKLSGVLRRGLGEYFGSEGFDHRWVEKKELEDLENKWKTYKIAEAISDKAQAHFLQAFNTYSLKAYKIFGYQND